MASVAVIIVTSIGGCKSLGAIPSPEAVAQDSATYAKAYTDAEACRYGEGAAMGYRGMIHVRVGMDNGAITEITVIESREDRAVGEAAIDELTDLVLMYNTTELDAVSGATETSRGFFEAVENAIMNL